MIRGLAGASYDSSILSKSIPVQVERSEQDARAFYFIQCSLTIKSPCNSYVEEAGLIFRTTTHHHTTAFSFTHYDYNYDYDYLSADSTALDSGASSNINSAVTPGLCSKKGMGFVCFPHATPIYYDLLRRSALPSIYSGGVAC